MQRTGSELGWKDIVMCDLKGHSPMALPHSSLPPSHWLLPVLPSPVLRHELKWPHRWVSHVACLLGIHTVSAACSYFASLFPFLSFFPSAPALSPSVAAPGGSFLTSRMYRQDLGGRQRPPSFWPFRKERNWQFRQLLPAGHWAKLWACVILHNSHSGPVGCTPHLYSTDGDTGARRI